MSNDQQAQLQPIESSGSISNEVDELETLFETSKRVVSQRDLKMALVEVMDGLQKLVPYSSGAVYFHQPDSEWLEPMLVRGPFKETLNHYKIPYAKSITGRALRNYEMTKIDSVANDPDVFFIPIEEAMSDGSILIAPLGGQHHKETWGLVVRRFGAWAFTNREFKLFQLFASYAEIAIENARLYELALSETEALRRVNAIMRTVGSLKSADQIYFGVAEEIKLVIDCERIVFSEIELKKDLITVVFDSAVRDWKTVVGQFKLSGSAAEQVIQRGHYIVQNDLSATNSPHYANDEYMATFGVRSYAMFPLRHEGQIERVMMVAGREPNIFDAAKISFLEILAGQLAVTAANVQLFDRLRRTRRQWQITLDAIPDAVLLLDANDLSILQVNQAAAKLSACRPDELVGQVYRDIFYGVDPCLCYFPLEQLQQPGAEFNEEANGTFSGRIYQRSIYPIFDRNGLLSELVTHIREVTATKMMEQQLAQTVRLKAVGEMAAGIAHDFNNSLAGILGNVELMLLEATEPPMRTQLLQLKQAALDGADTVRRIQSFGRKDGRKTYRKFDLNAVVREVVELTRPRWQNQAQQQGIYIGMVLRLSDHLTVYGNPAEIKEALTNLIFNALDAMPKGGTLTLNSYKEQVGDELAAVLQIIDSGQGIAEADKPTIFEPFFTTKGLKGTGLGLSMARQIMAEHEGEIGFESIVGQGTTFHLRLPLVQPDKNYSRKNGSFAGTKNEPEVKGGHSRILVIDDDKMLSSILKRILERYGHTVDATNSGKQGLELFQSKLGEFDIVFTDLSMPEMSGYEVARVLKSLDSAVIIILMTGWGADLNSETLAARGIDLHIAKPYHIAEIQTLLEKAEGLRRDIPPPLTPLPFREFH